MLAEPPNTDATLPGLAGVAGRGTLSVGNGLAFTLEQDVCVVGGGTCKGSQSRARRSNKIDEKTVSDCLGLHYAKPKGEPVMTLLNAFERFLNA